MEEAKFKFHIRLAGDRGQRGDLLPFNWNRRCFYVLCEYSLGSNSYLDFSGPTMTLCNLLSTLPTMLLPVHFACFLLFVHGFSVEFAYQATLEHEAIDEVCEKFGVDAKEIIRVLEEGEQHDPLAIAYKLIIDNKRIENEEAISEFK